MMSDLSVKGGDGRVVAVPAGISLEQLNNRSELWKVND